MKPIIERIKGPIPFKTPKIKLSSLGEDAGIIGASYLAVESIITAKFHYKIKQEVLS